MPDSSCASRTSALPPMRSTLEASNSSSERELAPVAMRSSVSNGALTTPATHSPESPRRTETSPLIKLIRATPRFISSGSWARAGVAAPAIQTTAPVSTKNRRSNMRFMAKPRQLRPSHGTAHAKPELFWNEWILCVARPAEVAENHQPWLCSIIALMSQHDAAIPMQHNQLPMLLQPRGRFRQYIIVGGGIRKLPACQTKPRPVEAQHGGHRCARPHPNWLRSALAAQLFRRRAYAIHTGRTQLRRRRWRVRSQAQRQYQEYKGCDQGRNQEAFHRPIPSKIPPHYDRRQHRGRDGERHVGSHRQAQEHTGQNELFRNSIKRPGRKRQCQSEPVSGGEALPGQGRHGQRRHQHGAPAQPPDGPKIECTGEQCRQPKRKLGHAEQPDTPFFQQRIE